MKSTETSSFAPVHFANRHGGKRMETRTVKADIISKCFQVSGWFTRMGKAELRGDEKEFHRIDKILDILIQELKETVKCT